MRTAIYFVLLWMTLLAAFQSLAQDFSNKGKDFWVGYGNHVRMFTNDIPTEKMQLYITSDVATSGKVEIGSINFSQDFTVTPNQITAIDIPRAAALTNDGLYNHGIHVTAERPVVVYSFIYFNAISGATLCLPTATLGRDYYSVNFTQRSNDPSSHSYFFVIATDTGTTSVEITPSARTKGGKAAGVPFLVNLKQGQVYQVLGEVTGSSGLDLTGSHIRSVNTGSGCKRIAVFSGSGKMRIGYDEQNTSDNLYQQMYPVATWGKRFIAVPGLVNKYNFFRIVCSDPAARVTLNGRLLPASSFVNGFYYEYGTDAVSVVESDKPILVAQYFTTGGNYGNPADPGDPDMIYLNPVEQTIDRVTLNSMQPETGTAIREHYLNVVLRNDPKAIASFKIDGVPYTNFTPVPADNRYAYLRVPTTRGTHNVTCDTGFNIISYGFGRFESYGYSGGTNLKDLYQFISMRNQYATVDFPASCVNTPFTFAMTFPYQPTQVKWMFNGLFADETIDNPLYDSTWVANGKRLYQYRLKKTYSVPAIGTYPIKLLAKNPTIDDCTGEQEIFYDLEIINRPRANFSITSTGCLKDSVYFTDSSSTFGRRPYRWSWNLGNGTTSTVPRPGLLYDQPGVYPVTYSLITEIGCLSDTVSKTVALSAQPVAAFGVQAPYCLQKPLSFTDASTSDAPLAKWTWNFGDGSPEVVVPTGVPQTHVYGQTGAYAASLRVQTITGCNSAVAVRTLNVRPHPVAAFTFGKACLPSGALQFTNTSSIPDGTSGTMTYLWDFGDGSSGTGKDPLHAYASTGPFTVTLKTISEAGCSSDSVQTVTTVYDQPVAGFEVNAPEACPGTLFSFTDKSTSVKSVLNQWKWFFGDGPVATSQNPEKAFETAGTKEVKLVVISEAGCISDTARRAITVNPTPIADFTFSGPACANRELLFTDRSSVGTGGLNKWSWSFGDGQQSEAAGQVRHTYPGVQVYTATLQVETDKGCRSAPVSREIAVNPVPVAGFMLPASCIADPYSQFTDTGKIADGSGAAFSYRWNFGDNRATPANPNTSTLQHPKHKYSAADTFYVMQTIISNAGCRDSVTQRFIVNGARPAAAFILRPAGELCSNRALELVNQSTVDFGSVTRLEIVWDSSATRPGERTVEPYPQPGKVFTHSFPEFFRPAARTDSVYVVAYSGETCRHSSWQPLTLKAVPELSFAPMDPVCANSEPFVLTQGRLLNDLPGLGTYTGAGVRPGALFHPGAAAAGINTLTYTFAANNGCINSVTGSVRVGRVPTANAGPDAYLHEGSSLKLNGMGTGLGISYRWEPAATLSSAVTATPIASPVEDTHYRLTVTSSEGCTATDEVKIIILKNLRIPNVFSPNGDGLHDRWEIPYLSTYPGVTVDVFNRYGQPVFRSSGYSRPWDGTVNGKPVPVGTYYYVINPKNGRPALSGFVEVVR